MKTQSRRIFLLPQSQQYGWTLFLLYAVMKIMFLSLTMIKQLQFAIWCGTHVHLMLCQATQLNRQYSQNGCVAFVAGKPAQIITCNCAARQIASQYVCAIYTECIYMDMDL